MPWSPVHPALPTYERVDLVPVEELLAALNNVVVVVVVVAVVVQLALLLVRAVVVALGLLRPALLLRVVHLVDVLIRLDQVHAHLAQRTQGRVAEVGRYPRLHRSYVCRAGRRGAAQALVDDVPLLLRQVLLRHQASVDDLKRGGGRGGA